MQSSLDYWTSARVGVDEDKISFRPSPNFKNMKKFLKSRSQTSDSSLPHNSTIKGNYNDDRSAVQPPLPRGPPPPDTPPPLLSLKKSPGSPVSQNGTPEYEAIENAPLDRFIKQETEENESSNLDDNNTLKPLCRDFVREACKRVPCDYRHKIIIDIDSEDLKKVYNFCHNYQNFVCVKKDCKFIHATPFEERKFYRTGILPPACRKRKLNNQQNNCQPVPMFNMLDTAPPPPPPPFQNDTKEFHHHSSGVDITHPIHPPSQSHNFSLFNGNKKENHPPLISVRKLWPEADAGMQQHEQKFQRFNSDCDTCQVVENRMEYANSQIEKLNKSLAETRLKCKLLEKRYRDLLSVLDYAFATSGANQKRLDNDR